MRPLLMAFLFLSCITIYAQPGPVTVTMAGIGEIKIGMKRTDLEKLLQTTIPLKNLLKKQPDRDTVSCTYKGIPIQAFLDNDYMNGSKDIVVTEVKSSSPIIKTKSGIGIGNDKLKIITVYDGYTIYLLPEYDNERQTKIKNKSTLWLHGDDSGRVIIFYLTDNKVTAMSVTWEEGD